MKYILGIPHVNRIDLLKIAVDSVKPAWEDAFIIDNSESGEIMAHPSDWPVPIERFPGLSLTFSQSMNLIQELARRKGCDTCLFMHNDAEVGAGVVEKFLELVEAAFQEQPRWGVAFTNYDTLAAFNMSAVDLVGPWDVNLPQYFADNDYYRRIRLAGFDIIQTGLRVLHHNDASSTIKSDPRRGFLNSITFPLYGEYYGRKWGGPPGGEVFTKPFNNELFK